MMKIMMKEENMSKLEELKQMISGLFEAATDKSTIDKVAAINNKLGDLEQEHKSLEDRDAEILKSYKDLIQHTAVGGNQDVSKSSTVEEDISGNESLDLDAMFSTSSIQKFLAESRKSK